MTHRLDHLLLNSSYKNCSQFILCFIQSWLHFFDVIFNAWANKIILAAQWEVVSCEKDKSIGATKVI